MNEIVPETSNAIQLGKAQLTVPALITDAGEHAAKRFIEFFIATIRNRNTREAYGRAVRDFFDWCDEHGIGPLIDIEAIHVAAYVEQMTAARAAQTVKQQLAAIRALLDFLVTGGVLPANPASAVRGPKHSQAKGKTPVLFADDARELIRSIDVSGLPGLRDRAIIGVMTYAFARVSAALAMDVQDVFPMHHRLWLRLTEKGGKHHEIPCHHSLEQYLREYLDVAAREDGPLFPTLWRRSGQLTDRRLNRRECLAMIKRRCRDAGLENAHMLSNHTFRGTGITAYLSNPDSRLELAQQMAAHSDPKTTRMYDRRSDEISLDEVEKIGI
ncbi:MAG: tyrosine-type recombinase/integrase [Pseudomonadota bacterium]